MGLSWISILKEEEWMAALNPDTKEISKDSINSADSKKFWNFWKPHETEEKILSKAASFLDHPMWLEREISRHVAK